MWHCEGTKSHTIPVLKEVTETDCPQMTRVFYVPIRDTVFFSLSVLLSLKLQ